MPDPDDEPLPPRSIEPNSRPNGSRRYVRPADLIDKSLSEANKDKLSTLSELLRKLAALKPKGERKKSPAVEVSAGASQSDA